MLDSISNTIRVNSIVLKGYTVRQSVPHTMPQYIGYPKE